MYLKLVNELKKENFSLKMKIFFYEDGMKYIEDNVNYYFWNFYNN